MKLDVFSLFLVFFHPIYLGYAAILRPRYYSHGFLLSNLSIDEGEISFSLTIPQQVVLQSNFLSKLSQHDLSTSPTIAPENAS